MIERSSRPTGFGELAKDDNDIEIVHDGLEPEIIYEETARRGEEDDDLDHALISPLVWENIYKARMIN